MQLSTTIMIIPPHEVLAIATPILQRYGGDNLIRVPAHITVLFPFVPYEELDTGCDVVAGICRDVAPFDITLFGYGSFPGVAFMKPENPRPIQALFRQIYAAFPACKPYGGEFGDDLHPHMTVGEFASEDEQAAVILPNYIPVTFRAERLHVMYGVLKAPLPWVTHAVIPLQGEG
jgi:2'-5' RNA ligase